MNRWVVTLQDQIGNTILWPLEIQRCLLQKKHLTNQERFKCTVFLLCNGMAPWLIEDYYKFRYRFDKNAWRQIDYVIRKYPKSNWTAWNTSERRSM